LSAEVLLGESGVSRGFFGEDVSGGEMMDRGPANCGVACGKHGCAIPTLLGLAGDGGSRDVSTKAGLAIHHRPHYS